MGDLEEELCRFVQVHNDKVLRVNHREESFARFRRSIMQLPPQKLPREMVVEAIDILQTIACERRSTSKRVQEVIDRLGPLDHEHSLDGCTSCGAGESPSPVIVQDPCQWGVCAAIRTVWTAYDERAAKRARLAVTTSVPSARVVRRQVDSQAETQRSRDGSQDVQMEASTQSLSTGASSSTAPIPPSPRTKSKAKSTSPVVVLTRRRSADDDVEGKRRRVERSEAQPKKEARPEKPKARSDKGSSDAQRTEDKWRPAFDAPKSLDRASIRRDLERKEPSFRRRPDLPAEAKDEARRIEKRKLDDPKQSERITAPRSQDSENQPPIPLDIPEEHDNKNREVGKKRKSLQAHKQNIVEEDWPST